MIGVKIAGNAGSTSFEQWVCHQGRTDIGCLYPFVFVAKSYRCFSTGATVSVDACQQALQAVKGPPVVAQGCERCSGRWKGARPAVELRSGYLKNPEEGGQPHRRSEMNRAEGSVAHR